MFPPDEDDEDDIIPSVDIPGEDDEPPAVDVPDPADSVPSVDVPDAESNVSVPDTEDVPADLQQSFWTLVVVVDVAMLAAGLGVLLFVFRGEATLAAALFVAAAGLLFYARERYRTVSEREYDESESKDAENEEPEDDDPKPKDA